MATSYSTSVSLRYSIDFTFAAKDSVSAAVFLSALHKSVTSILSSPSFTAQLSQQIVSSGGAGFDVTGTDPPSVGSAHYQSLVTTQPTFNKASSSSNAGSSSTNLTSQMWFIALVTIVPIALCVAIVLYFVMMRQRRSDDDQDDVDNSAPKMSFSDAVSKNLYTQSKDDQLAMSNPGLNLRSQKLMRNSESGPTIEMSTRIYGSERNSRLNDEVNPGYGLVHTISTRPEAPLEALPAGQETEDSIISTIYGKGRLSAAVDNRLNPAFRVSSPVSVEEDKIQPGQPSFNMRASSPRDQTRPSVNPIKAADTDIVYLL